MKRILNRHQMLTVFAVSLIVMGCMKEKGMEPGSAINFSASSSALETRTVYGADASSKQYIDWEAGDKLTIVKVFDTNKQACDYEVQAAPTASTPSDKSVATVVATPASGQSALTWTGTGDHTFYAMYPNGTFYAGTSTLSGSVSAAQSADMKMPYGYMFATPVTKTVTPTYTVKTVDLELNPAFTAFQFTLINSGSSSITLSSFRLTSLVTEGASEKKLNGDISYTFGSGTSCAANTTTDAEKTISVSSVTIGANSSTTFVITTLPNAFASGDLTIICEDAATETAKKLPINVALDANKKHAFSITLPSFVAEYQFSVTNPTLTYNGTSASATVTSSKNGSTAVPWFVEGYYATEADAEAGTNKLAAYNTTGLLTAEISNGNGSASGESVSISYSAATTQTLAEYINDNIKNNSTFGGKSSSDRYINLTHPANLTSDLESDMIDESANCYIVNGPGYYRIPLIMGNGRYNSDFINYKGNTVQTNAYLHNQGGTPTAAKVIWEDVNGLINELTTGYDLGQSAISSTGSGDSKVYWLKFYIDKGNIQQGNAVIAVYDGDATVMWSYHIWVTDYVPSNYPNTFPSSYTPPVNLTHNSSASPQKQYQIPPYNLGWVVTSTKNKGYKRGIVYVRLHQGTTSNPEGGYAIMKIERPEELLSHSTSDLDKGHNPYYQWGRKDPLFGSYDSTLESNSNTDYGLVVGMERVSISSYTNQLFISTGIFTPGKSINQWLSGRSGDLIKRLWSKESTVDYNNQSYNNQDIIKTIYDPCPAGLSVPSFNCFSNISSTLPDGLPQVRYRNGSNMDNSHLYWYGCFSTAGYAMAHYAGGSLWNYAGIAAAMSIRPIVN